jgi:hypothetical protein
MSLLSGYMCWWAVALCYGFECMARVNGTMWHNRVQLFIINPGLVLLFNIQRNCDGLRAN